MIKVKTREGYVARGYTLEAMPIGSFGIVKTGKYIGNIAIKLSPRIVLDTPIGGIKTLEYTILCGHAVLLLLL